VQVKEKVHCIKCMVDRICVSRDIEPKDHAVDVDAESFPGRIIVLTPLDDDSIVPFGGDVLVPKEKATAKFFYKRKFSIVNGKLLLYRPLYVPLSDDVTIIVLCSESVLYKLSYAVLPATIISDVTVITVPHALY
jgi:hypothetical protein